MLFLPIKFKTHVQLSPSELDSKYQERIYDKLRETYEGVCTKYGYIKPGSIEIVKRSYASFVKEHFNGYAKFDLLCRAEVCNPVQGTVVKATIKNKNQLGILAESTLDINNVKTPILDIIIPIKSAGIISQVSLDTLQLNDTIMVEVMGKKYQMKDKKISIIGRVISMNKEEEEEVPLEEEEVDEELEEEEFEVQDGGEDLEEEEEEEEEGKKKKITVHEEEEEKESEEEEEDFEEDFYDEEEDFGEEEGGDLSYEDYD
jgi:DNA-directed RNA polymerase subunit E'/Rpb7